jgi:hypothetical protein
MVLVLCLLGALAVSASLSPCLHHGDILLGPIEVTWVLRRDQAVLGGFGCEGSGRLRIALVEVRLRRPRTAAEQGGGLLPTAVTGWRSLGASCRTGVSWTRPGDPDRRDDDHEQEPRGHQSNREESHRNILLGHRLRCN